jgi:hypothetical protein
MLQMTIGPWGVALGPARHRWLFDDRNPPHSARHLAFRLNARIRTAETTDRAAQGQSVSRKTVAEVPLAGLSFGNAEGVEQGHFGLHGMRERAERLGGTLEIESTPGSGTTVRATVIRRDYDREIGEPAAAESAASLQDYSPASSP